MNPLRNPSTRPTQSEEEEDYSDSQTESGEEESECGDTGDLEALPLSALSCCDEFGNTGDRPLTITERGETLSLRPAAKSMDFRESNYLSPPHPNFSLHTGNSEGSDTSHCGNREDPALQASLDVLEREFSKGLLLSDEIVDHIGVLGASVYSQQLPHNVGYDVDPQ